MITLLEQVINEIRLSKASTGNKLKGKTFEELEVGDKIYAASYYKDNGNKSKLFGVVTRKIKTEDGYDKIYWSTRKNQMDATITLKPLSEDFTILEGSFPDDTYCVAKWKDNYFFYSTTDKEFVKNAAKKYCNWNIV